MELTLQEMPDQKPSNNEDSIKYLTAILIVVSLVLVFTLILFCTYLFKEDPYKKIKNENQELVSSIYRILDKYETRNKEKLSEIHKDIEINRRLSRRSSISIINEDGTTTEIPILKNKDGNAIYPNLSFG